MCGKAAELTLEIGESQLQHGGDAGGKEGSQISGADVALPIIYPNFLSSLNLWFIRSFRKILYIRKSPYFAKLCLVSICKLRRFILSEFQLLGFDPYSHGRLFEKDLIF